MEYGLHILELDVGDEVLLPDFICDVVLSPLNSLGLTPIYYSVNDSLEPRYERIERQISKKTKAILTVNYFGFPQPYDPIRAICKKHGIWHIEDNAQGFLSHKGDQPLGTFGDLSFTSVRKTLPLKNGAYLCLNHPTLIGRFQSSRYMPYWEKEPCKTFYLKRFLRWIDMNTFLPLSKFRKEKSIPKPGSGELEQKPFGMDPIAKWLLFHYDLQSEIKKRRRNYALWLQFFLHSPVQPVFDHLPDGVCPFAFPVYVEDQEKWLNWGWKHGIEIRTWPTLPLWVYHNRPETVERWKRLLLFPLTKSPQNILKRTQ